MKVEEGNSAVIAQIAHQFSISIWSSQMYIMGWKRVPPADFLLPCAHPVLAYWPDWRDAKQSSQLTHFLLSSGKCVQYSKCITYKARCLASQTRRDPFLENSNDPKGFLYNGSGTACSYRGVFCKKTHKSCVGMIWWAGYNRPAFQETML